MYNILVVDDDPIECDSLSELFKYEGYFVDSTTDAKVASKKLDERLFNVVVSDVRMPEVTGFDLLEQIKENHPETSVILITGYGQIEDAVSAIKLGAFDYIMKPFNDDAIRDSISKAIELKFARSTKLENQTSVKLEDIIGQDKEMQNIRELIKKIVNTDATVLISGESGTGKSLIAKTIHYNSPRRHKPYIEIPCGAIPEQLLESELFGHSKGSFTGAINEKPGSFELADGGTILLDGICSASLSFQIKLLRVLQDKKFERLGSYNTITTDIRIIVATNSSLKNEIEKGNFRKDLYYRISVIPINIPPLHERTSDIKLLASHFLYKYRSMYDKKDLSISDETMYELQNYSWPGNVRELENTIQRAIITAGGAYININDTHFVENKYTPKLDAIGTYSLKKAMERPEKEFIEHALEHFNWNKNKTAGVLGLNRTTLYKKMKKYDLLSKKPLTNVREDS